MIRDMWYPVLLSGEVRKKKIVRKKRLGENLLFFRDSRGNVKCISDRCAHRGASLSLGEHKGDAVACPFHGFEYNGEGKCTCVPANGRNADVPQNIKVNSYQTREKEGFIWIWNGEERAEYPEIPWFEDINGKFKYITVKDYWNVHYSRSIENQLDAVHLPFVHKTTIGKGNATIVNGPLVIISGRNMTVYVNNEVDTGQKPVSPSKMEKPEKEFHLEFLFPNIWQNFISRHIRIFIAFIPVDDEHNILYMRFLQDIVRAPILWQLFCLTGNLFSLVIAHQDRRVVHTQIPKKTSMKMDENLILGDTPIIVYRKMRDAFQKGEEPKI